MSDAVTFFLQQLRNTTTDFASREPRGPAPDLAWLPTATSDQITRLLSGLVEVYEQGTVAPAAVYAVLPAVTRAVLQGREGDVDQPSRVTSIERLYGRLRGQRGPRHLLLSLLAARGDRFSLATFAELMVTDPPREPNAVVQAFAPLWRSPQACYASLFPRLLQALQDPAAAVVILDLANYLYAGRHLPDHPARPRAAQLTALLGHVVERLEGWEDACRQQGVIDLNVARQVADGVALAVALAYTLSLLDQRQASGKLHRMLQLQHRRLRAEAAAVLARWQDAVGEEQLIRLAAEPSVRLRVLAYAEELGLLDRIDVDYRTAQARAEAELVTRLAEPDWFGMPPARCELLAQRRLYWPGLADPVDCFLFLYTYPLPSGLLRNVALAGPGTDCVACDLTHLTTDDQFAAYAGWQAEHAEIRQSSIDPDDSVQAAQITRLEPQIAASGYEQFEPALRGVFFGEQVLVGTARKDGEPGRVVASAEGCCWWGLGDPRRPLTVEVAYAIYKGRQLLSSFNPAAPDGGRPARRAT